jgi:hypothetical protein
LQAAEHQLQRRQPEDELREATAGGIERTLREQQQRAYRCNNEERNVVAIWPKWSNEWRIKWRSRGYATSWLTSAIGLRRRHDDTALSVSTLPRGRVVEPLILKQILESKLRGNQCGRAANAKAARSVRLIVILFISTLLRTKEMGSLQIILTCRRRYCCPPHGAQVTPAPNVRRR